MALDRPKLHPLLHVLETHALFLVFSSFFFFFSISCLSYSVIPLGFSFFFCRCELLLLVLDPPSSAATNCISRCIHARSRTSGYTPPASQPETRIRSPERRIERNSKKQKGSQKEKKSIGAVRDLVLLGLLTNRESSAPRITRAASREIELRSQLDNFLAAPPLVAFSGLFSAFSSLVNNCCCTAAFCCCFCYICTVVGSMARLGLVPCIPLRPLVAWLLHQLTMHACMAQQNPRKKRATREMAPKGRTARHYWRSLFVSLHSHPPPRSPRALASYA